MRDARVVIAGFGAISAAGRDSAALLAALRTNTSCLRADPRFNGPRFQSNIVGAAPLEGSDNPAQQLAATALREAVTAAGKQLCAIPGERLGLVLSTTKAKIE